MSWDSRLLNIRILTFFLPEFVQKVASESRNTKETECRLLGCISSYRETNIWFSSKQLQMRSFLQMEVHSQVSYLCPGSRSSWAVHFLPSSHDADHLLPNSLSHESPIHDPGHVVVAPSQTHQRPVASDSYRHALWFGLTAASKPTRQTPERVSLHPLPRQGHSFLGTAAAYIPKELLDETSVLLRAGLGSTDCSNGGFSCSRRLPCWTGPLTGSWG